VQTVVVTGSAGALGRRVVRLLAADPSRRVIGIDLVGTDALDALEAGPNVEHRVMDLSALAAAGRPDPLDAVCAGADTMIHLAWSAPDPSSTNGRAPINLLSLRRVLGACSRVGARSLVHLSSATVYGAWADNPVPLAEEAPVRPNPRFVFAAEKAEAEREVAEWSEMHPATAVAVLRPAVTLGSAGPALYRALAGTDSLRADDGGRPMQFLHVDDLASATVLAARSRLRGVYNVAPDGWITADDAAEIVGGVARVPLPRRLADAIAMWGWRLIRRGTPKEALPYAIHPWVIANGRIRQEGWTPLHSNEEVLVSTDDRVHWTDLPPGTRQEVALVASAVVLLAFVAGLIGGGAALAVRSRRRAHARRVLA
jgi:nucleoside-diphosphate-sugar epimerase